MRTPTIIFGGSFNPFGNHHLAILIQGQALHPKADFWVVPSFRHPVKEASTFAPFDHRVRMAKLAILQDMLLLPSETPTAARPGVRILDTEREMGVDKVFTYDLLTYLSKKHPDRSFKFMVGGDLKSQVSTWEKGSEVERDFGFEWMPNLPMREGFTHATHIRQMIRDEDSKWWDFVPLKVGLYIHQHGLFR